MQKRVWIYFPSSEIRWFAVYDYAQNGVELKKNIREYWWKAMVQMNNIVWSGRFYFDASNNMESI
jgi:glycyl-tRNA synthetase (class II)